MTTALEKIAADPSRRRIDIPPIPVGKIILKKLSEKHKTIVALHAQATDRHTIAQMAECTPEYVSFVVKQPLAQQYLSEIQGYLDDRMRAMFHKSVDAIDRALECGNSDTELKAARLQMEAAGKLKSADKDQGTAEDIVASILERATVVIAQTANVQVNQGE